MSFGPTGYDGGGRTVDAIANAFYPLYRRLFDSDSTFVTDMEQKLAQARMAYNVEMYLSMALAVGAGSGVLLWILGLSLGSIFAGQLNAALPHLAGVFRGASGQFLEVVLVLLASARVPSLVFLTGLVFGTIGASLGFASVVIIPYLRAGRRRREINMLLPDAVSFMYALSNGGMNQLEIFEAVAEADDTYGEVAGEFRTILQETEYFDTDYRSAIRTQAFETPSEDLNQFLTDMLSVIDSGGDLTRFLDDKKSLQFRTAKQQQERILETLELFAELFVTLSLFPLLLIIMLIVLSMLGQSRQIVLYATVYALIPLFGMVFLVIISTIRQDDPGDGVLHADRDAKLFEEETDRGLFDYGLIEKFVGTHYIFDRIKKREGTYQTLTLLRRPDLFFRDNPTYTLFLTVPAAFVLVSIAIQTGTAPTSWDGLIEAPVWGTFVYLYVPVLLTGIPVAVFYEWNVRSRRGILENLSEDLRKLSSANDTGLTLLESIQNVAETSSGKLANEFEVIHAKSTYGMSLKESLVVFNNKYRLPPLARTVKLISKAQEASSQISAVLTTAAQATENRNDIERERKSRTRMQVVIVVMTFLTLLGVMAMLKVRFIDVMASMTDGNTNLAGSFATSINADLLSLLFFHAVTLQAIVTGLVSGYIRDARILSGVRYVVALLLITLLVWVVVG